MQAYEQTVLILWDQSHNLRKENSSQKVGQVISSISSQLLNKKRKAPES